MTLERVRETWTALGERDAFWAVLTGNAGADRKWNEEDFFRSGAEEIATLIEELPPDLRRDAALDFGCGAGRLTRALGEHFGRAVGVDIAPTMIRQARRLNRRHPRCEFVVNDRADLSLFADATFDLVYSNITLQHMPPELSSHYIGEFFRVTREGGVVVFQIPAEFVRPPRPRTPLLEALPGRAFRAHIRINTRAIRCAPGAAFPLIARVRNVSDVSWPAGGSEDGDNSLRLGNHWRSRWTRKMLQLDDVRAGLPHDLAPGEETEVGLNITAPSRPGRYLLELDCVQEQVDWFAVRGSKTTPVPVHVDARLAPGTVHGLPPRMEMHGIPRLQVESLIRTSGGELLFVKEDDAPGTDWTSFRYYAVRRPTRYG
jgi:SAM-dependent methyltransferase